MVAHQRLEVHEFMETIGISNGKISSNLNNQLVTRTLFARWVPRLLTIDHKRNQETNLKKCVVLLNRNPGEFWSGLIKINETWIYHNAM